MESDFEFHFVLLIYKVLKGFYEDALFFSE